MMGEVGRARLEMELEQHYAAQREAASVGEIDAIKTLTDRICNFVFVAGVGANCIPCAATIITVNCHVFPFLTNNFTKDKVE